MEDRTGCSRRRDRGDLLGSPFFKKGGVLEDPPGLWSGKVLSLSVESLIMVAPDPVLADALPHLSYLVLFEMSYELFELFVTELKFLDRN